MAAKTTNLANDAGEEPAAVRVESFLRCVETTRRRTLRVRMVAAAVGAAVATVVFLTSIGVVAPDAPRLAASALVAGLFAAADGHAIRGGAEHATTR